GPLNVSTHVKDGSGIVPVALPSGTLRFCSAETQQAVWISMVPSGRTVVSPAAQRGGIVFGTELAMPPTSPPVAGSGQQYTTSAFTTSQGSGKAADGTFDTFTFHLAIVPLGPASG